MRWLASVAILGILACGGDRSSQPRTEAPATAAPPPDTSAADNRPVIVAFGDSLTDGYGVPAGQKYTDFLQQALDEQGLTYRVVNAGVSGDTTANALDRVPSVVALRPKLVVVEIGGNDGLRGLPVEQTRRNLDEIVNALQSSGAKVLLWGMTLPRNYGANYVRDFERAFTETGAKYGVKVLPVSEFGRVEMQRDGIHPTGAGYRRVASAVLKYARKELGE